MERICLQCQKDFHVDANVVRKGNGKYCSYKCRNLFNWAKKEYKDHMSLVHKGYVPMGNEALVKWLKSEEGRQSISERCKGDKSVKWIKDRTKLSKGRFDRHSPAHFEWKSKVNKRDYFKCRINDVNCKGSIETHHILRWKDFPELRYDVNNGITLCHFHHPRKKKDEMTLEPIFRKLILEKI